MYYLFKFDCSCKNLNICFNYILLQHFFNLGPLLVSADGRAIAESIEAYLQKRYDDNKYKFKKKKFTQQGGVEKLDEIKEKRPDNIRQSDWQKYVNFSIHTLLLLLLLLLLHTTVYLRVIGICELLKFFT